MPEIKSENSIAQAIFSLNANRAADVNIKIHAAGADTARGKAGRYAGAAVCDAVCELGVNAATMR